MIAVDQDGEGNEVDNSTERQLLSLFSQANVKLTNEQKRRLLTLMKILHQGFMNSDLPGTLTPTQLGNINYDFWMFYQAIENGTLEEEGLSINNMINLLKVGS